MNKTALICGVSGQDGAYLAQLLLEKGYRVVGTSRDVQGKSFGNLIRLGIQDRLERIALDPEDFAQVCGVLETVAPHEVYNLSGQSSVELSFEEPLETFRSIALATSNWLEAMRASGQAVRFFNAGSSECFGDTGGVPADETTPLKPQSPYAVAKSAAHWATANYRDAYGLFACTGILYNHESPLRPERFVTQKIVAAAHRIARGSQEKLHLGNLVIVRDWGWAPEYVEVMWRMLQQAEPEEFVVATGQSHSLEEFVVAAFEAVGLNWREHVEFDPRFLRPTDIAVVRGNPAKAREQLGWQAASGMPDVVRKMVNAVNGSAL
jgi:GDPmannose 4,6-dehydratase